MKRRDTGRIYARPASLLRSRHREKRKREKKGGRSRENLFRRALPQYLTEARVGLDLSTIHCNDGPLAACRNVCVSATVRGVE